MEAIGAWMFMGVVVVIGVGAGFWLQGKLEETDQDVKLPSAYKRAA